MDYVSIEFAQNPHHSRQRNAERQRGDLGEHSRRHPIDRNTLVLGGGGFLARWIVRRDHDRIVAGAVQVLENPEHRV